MPEGVNQRPGNMETVRKRFGGWDSRFVIKVAINWCWY
jgi:hypothetical protein